MENQKDDYLPEHYPENQTCERVEDIFINPHLRESFNSTPNNDRDSLEWEHWYARPFIEIDEHSEESYQDYVKRMSSIDIEIKLDTESQFYERQKELKDAWLKAWPTGNVMMCGVLLVARGIALVVLECLQVWVKLLNVVIKISLYMAAYKYE